MAASSSLSHIDPADVTLGKLLGVGGFGAVYKASHVNWGTVAIKQLRGVTFTDSIKKEAEKMWRAISSPYLVRIMGIIESPEDLSIVMEYFKNGSLKDFQQKYMRCECWARKVKMIQDIALGMNYLHTLKQPIIHRDLKLENVFVGDGFEAKIGDLGLAVSSKTSRNVSRVSGTRSHIPPEALISTAVEPDEFWDIYTFAITTYELTSGKDAWPQQGQFANDALIAAWVFQGHRPNLEAIPQDAPVEIVDIMKKCWVAEPKKRPIFKDILKCVTGLFEEKYESLIIKADRAILEQMDLVKDIDEPKSPSSAADSGIDSFWGSLENMSIKERSASDSGIGSASSSLSSAPGIRSPPVSGKTKKIPPPVPPKNPERSSLRTQGRMAGNRLSSGRLESPPPPLPAKGTTPPPFVKAKGLSTDLKPKPQQAHNMKEWRLVREFGREGDGEGEFRLANGIAVCHNGDIAVTNLNYEKKCNQLYMFNSDGTYKSTLKSHTTNPTGKLLYPHDVAVTSQGHLVIADQSKYVKVYDVNGSFIHSFCTLTPDENPNTEVCTTRVAVTPQDDIIIGDRERQLVTIHTQTDGWTPRKVTLPIKPVFLATNSQRHILVSDWKACKVIALSFEGIALFTLDTFRVDGKTGRPQGMVCDSNGDVYIAVMECNESRNMVIFGTGHIHQYDNTGVFLRCIAKGLYCPRGITMSNGSLYVANKKSVLIYNTQ